MSNGRNRHKNRPYGRKVDVREVKARFLIVCEDGKSAPNYFQGFRLKSAKVIPIGAGMNTLSLVEEAILLREKAGISSAKDQVWVVMDRDSFPQADYDNAIAKAKANGIYVAYANECFEFWLLLHFKHTTGHIPRSKLVGVLAELIPGGYAKSQLGIYEAVEDKMHIALKNASTVRAYHKEIAACPIHNCCPCTEIDLLVREMLKYL
jgi:hypothetical protein